MVEYTVSHEDANIKGSFCLWSGEEPIEEFPFDGPMTMEDARLQMVVHSMKLFGIAPVKRRFPGLPDE